MKFGLIALLALGLLTGFSFAQGTIGTFSCPSGQVEDLQCAAACCEDNGGSYSFSEETCTVDSTAQWNAAMECEQDEYCCKSASGASTGSGSCCGSSFIIAGLALAAIALYARSD